MMVAIYAHRGKGFGARENSLEAFRRVTRSPLKGVELDVRLTRDAVPVIHHDPDLPEGKRRVPLARIPFRKEGFPLPTLYDALKVLLPSHIVIVEIKPRPRTLEPIVEVIELFRPQWDRILISSFDPQVIEGFLGALPPLRRTLLVAGNPPAPKILALARELEVEGIHLERNQLETYPIGSFRDKGFRIRAYTINTIPQALRALELGAEELMSDRPLLLYRYFHRYPWKGFPSE
jgi:glycerophosphoryl diester phosphodiesterase